MGYSFDNLANWIGGKKASWKVCAAPDVLDIGIIHMTNND
jgi:hypothetical protein